MSSTLLFLARSLPRRAARPLGRAWGHLAFAGLRGRRRRAGDHLRRAYPDAGAGELTALARRAFAHHAAALAETAAAERLDARRLCRHLRLFGWHHLEAAESRGRGLVLLAPRIGPWRLAVLALGLYRGPLSIPGALGGDPLLRRLAARHERRLGHPVLASAAAGDAARRLADGGRIALLGDPSAPGRAADAPALAAGAPVVPVLARPGPEHGWRIVVREPLAAETDPESLARCCQDAVAREIHRRPELAAWWRTPALDTRSETLTDP